MEGLLNSYYEKFADGIVKSVEVPYEIPEGWEWVNLQQIALSNIGLTYKPSNITLDGIPVLRANNIKNGKINYDALVTVTIDTKIKENEFLKPKDILMATRSGSKHLVGKSAIITKVDTATAFGAFMCVTRAIIVSPEFVHYFYESLFFRNQLEEANTTTIYQVTQKMLKKTILALPPLSEQEKIAKEIQHYFHLLDIIDQNQSDLQQLSEQLRQKVLDVAMQGKLVAQDPNDEPASVLLEKIRAEKQRLFEEGKLKKKDLVEIEPVLTDDNAYYRNLPESWEVTSLGNLYHITSSKRVLQSEWKENGIPFYRAREIVSLKKNLPLKNPIYISEGTYQEKIKSSGIPSFRDILVTGVGTLGVAYTVPKDAKIYFKDGNVVWLQYLGFTESNYIELSLESSRIKRLINTTSGTTVGTLTIDKTKKLLIAVPPLAEQKRISIFTENIFMVLKKLNYSSK